MLNILCALPQLPVSYTTIVAALIVLISAIVGCKNGLIKSVFGIIGSIGTIIVAIFATPYLGNFFITQSWVEQLGSLGPAIVNVISFGLVAIIASIVFKLLNMLLNKLFNRDNIIGAINRILGFVFGIASGVLTVIFITYIINIFSGVSFVQSIIQNAQVDPIGKWLFNNNLIDVIFDWLGTKIPAIQQFLDSLKTVTQQIPKA